VADLEGEGTWCGYPTRRGKDIARYMISWPSTPEQRERAPSFTRVDESADPSAS
jgi:hypothetical protein